MDGNEAPKPKTTKKIEKPAISTPTAPTVGVSESGPSKGLLISIGVAVALILAGLIVYFSFFAGPTKKDYEAAYETATDVRSAYRDMSSSFSSAARLSPYDSEATTSRKYDDAVADLEAFKEAQKGFEDQKAFKDKELGELYEAYDEQQKKFVAFADNLLESYKPVAKVTRECNSASSGLSSAVSSPDTALAKFDEALKGCREAITAAKNLKDETLAKMVTKMDSFMDLLRSDFAKVIDEVKKKNYSGYSKAMSDMRKHTSDFSSDSRELTKEMTDRADTAELADHLNKLGRALTDKVNGN